MQLQGTHGSREEARLQVPSSPCISYMTGDGWGLVPSLEMQPGLQS